MKKEKQKTKIETNVLHALVTPFYFKFVDITCFVIVCLEKYYIFYLFYRITKIRYIHTEEEEGGGG